MDGLGFVRCDYCGEVEDLCHCPTEDMCDGYEPPTGYIGDEISELAQIEADAERLARSSEHNS